MIYNNLTGLNVNPTFIAYPLTSIYHCIELISNNIQYIFNQMLRQHNWLFIFKWNFKKIRVCVVKISFYYTFNCQTINVRRVYDSTVTNLEMFLYCVTLKIIRYTLDFIFVNFNTRLINSEAPALKWLYVIKVIIKNYNINIRKQIS